MERQTTQASIGHSFNGSIGAGMKSMFSPSGRTYYILEHKVSSKYHKAGESQKIIIDEILIGRDSACQVRFDDKFKTVSRKHAAIVRNGDEWKLVHLSATNPTLLNGKELKTKDWYLQNGDEIQLSTNGPKLGFILPQGDKKMVSSIGLSARLSLFRQQALKPYKTAMTVLSVLLLLTLCGGVGYAVFQHDKYDNMEAKYNEVVENISNSNNEIKKQLIKYQNILDSIDTIVKPLPQNPTLEIVSLVDSAKKDVFAIITSTYIETNGVKQQVGKPTQGTGFLLKNGKFVTARHCVESWLYAFDEDNLYANLKSTTFPKNVKVYSEIVAKNQEGIMLVFNSNDFIIDRNKDRIITFGTSEDNTPINARLVRPWEKYGSEDMWSTDFAYIKTNTAGQLVADYEGSTRLKAGQEIHVLGFPAGIGINDGSSSDIEPIYNKMTVSRNGLNEAGCIMVSQGVAHGNSGGPTFIVKDGKMLVVGIVSRLESRTQMIDQNSGLIGQQQQQYDHLVPIKYIN